MHTSLFNGMISQVVKALGGVTTELSSGDWIRSVQGHLLGRRASWTQQIFTLWGNSEGIKSALELAAALRAANRLQGYPVDANKVLRESDVKAVYTEMSNIGGADSAVARSYKSFLVGAGVKFSKSTGRPISFNPTLMDATRKFIEGIGWGAWGAALDTNGWQELVSQPTKTDAIRALFVNLRRWPHLTAVHAF